jgi:coronin-1B/1C/6
VLDFAFHPFIDHILASGGDDCYVKITALPDHGTAPLAAVTSAASLEGHEKKILYLSWHPTANGVLASASADHTIKMWDAHAAGRPIVENKIHCDTIQSMEWSYDGALMLSTCKDQQLRMWDPRDARSAAVKTPCFPVVTPHATFLSPQFISDNNALVIYT